MFLQDPHHCENLSDSQFVDYRQTLEARLQRCPSSGTSSGSSSATVVMGSVLVGSEFTPGTVLKIC